MTESAKKLARMFFEELYSHGRLELVDELIAEDYVAHDPGSEVNVIESGLAHASGREAVRQSLLSKPADISVVVNEQVAEGDVVVSRLTFASGGKEWTGVAIQKTRDGKLVETWRIANRA